MRSFTLLLLAVMALAVSACDTVKETAGLNRRSPDEFAVVKHPPLSVPPDFELRPPNSNVKGAAEGKPAAAEAQELLFNDTPGTTAPTNGLQDVLDKAGAKQAKPDIRGQLDKEASGVVVKDPAFVDRLLTWDGNDATKPDPTVDAAAEAKRLADLKAKQAPASGDKAKTQSGAKAPLEGVFE